MATVLRERIAQFRIKELQQCLEQLGLNKRGRKLDLQNRLLTYLGETETVAAPGQTSTDTWRTDAAGRVITQVWRQMHGLPDSAPQPQANIVLQERIASGLEASTSGAKSTPAVHAHAANEEYQPFHLSNLLVGAHNTQINCICGDNSDRGTMVQCEDESCGIWQHCTCVGVDALAMPEHYYCQNCRIALADPFWQVTDYRLIPAAMLRVMPGRPVVVRSSGKEQMLSAERAFDLSMAQLAPLRKNPQTEQLHVACLMLNDVVSNRMHWPRQAELRINSMVYRPYGRNSNTKLGNNARDEPANAAHRCVVGRNRVSLTCAEDRQFCLLAYTVRRRTLEAVKKMMAAPESAEAAVARVVSTLQGGKLGDDGDDDDLVVSNTAISLKDPLSGSRIQVSARFAGAPGIVAFDFDSFMSMVQRSRKWQDPHTLRNVTVHQLQLDPWMQAVLTCLKDVPDVTEVEVNAEGCWRPAGAEIAWLSTLKDTKPLTKAQLVKPSVVVKPDPDHAADDDSESESEGEELRKAARAFAAANKQSKAEPDVIVLDDSSDDDVAAAGPSAQPAGGSRHVWPSTGNATGQQPQCPPTRGKRHMDAPASHSNAVPGRLPAAASAVNVGFPNSPQSSWGQASSRQQPGSQQAGSSRQHPAAQALSSSGTANGSSAAGGPLRIRLPTRPTDRPEAVQQASRLASSNGLHPAASTSSASQLADAAARALAAQHARLQQQQQQARQMPNSLLGKRKQQDLNGHYGPYNQAVAQATGMSTLDQMHRGTDGVAELRHPQPYAATMNGYDTAPAYGQSSYSSGYWQPQMHGNAAVTSSPYSSHAIGSPGYSSGYSGLPPIHEQHAGVADATALQPPQYGLTDTSHLLPDGDSFMDALIDWPPEQATSINDTGEARRKEARLAAWKSRQGMHPQGCQQTTDDDVIVLD